MVLAGVKTSLNIPAKFQNLERLPTKGVDFSWQKPRKAFKLPAKDTKDLYRGLWITYLSKKPDLVEYASQFDVFHDMFRSSKMENCQADVIEAYVKGDRGHYVSVIKAGHWYKNMASKKKPSLSGQIQSAESKADEQLSLFNGESTYRGHWQTSR